MLSCAAENGCENQEKGCNAGNPLTASGGQNRCSPSETHVPESNEDGRKPQVAAGLRLYP